MEYLETAKESLELVERAKTYDEILFYFHKAFLEEMENLK